MMTINNIRLNFDRELDATKKLPLIIIIDKFSPDLHPIAVEEWNECEICYRGITHKNLSCDCCKKCICIDCFNKLLSCNVIVVVNDDINDITRDF